MRQRILPGGLYIVGEESLPNVFPEQRGLLMITRMKRNVEDGAGSKEQIMRAAIDVFAEKGKSGAKMQEIADKAQINKAMVYYYYSNKDSLFQTALVAILKHVYDRVFDILDFDAGDASPPSEKMTRLVSAHLTAFSENVNFAKTLLHALANEPKDLRMALRTARNQEEPTNGHLPEVLLSAIQEEIRKNGIQEVDAQQFLITITEMSLTFLIGKPIAEMFLNRQVESDEAFLRERGKSIVNMMLYGVVNGPYDLLKTARG